MTPLTCARVVALLERRMSGLSESERLLAESHLSECVGCRAHARVLEGARKIAPGGADSVLSPLSRELVLKRAFELAAAGGSSKAPRRSLSFLQLSAACLLVLAAASFALVVFERSHAAVAVQADELETGKLATSQGTLAAGADIPANVPLSSEGTARLHVANATVDAAPQTRLTWRAEADTLALDSGAVSVSVEHVAGRHFRVAAPGFLVEVVGTQFKVDLQGVRVSRGLVRVLSPDGRNLLALLPAGGAWSAPTVSAAEPPAPRASGSAAASSDSEQVAELDADDAKVRPTVVESVAQRLSAARRALAAGHVGEAEKLTDIALSSHASARESAEGRTLLAECAVARGNTARAVSLYLAVARAFSALPAGENALFAGARLSERTGPAPRARQLFEQYLQRYPNGRFHLEAERHLQKSSDSGR